MTGRDAGIAVEAAAARRRRGGRCLCTKDVLYNDAYTLPRRPVRGWLRLTVVAVGAVGGGGGSILLLLEIDHVDQNHRAEEQCFVLHWDLLQVVDLSCAGGGGVMSGPAVERAAPAAARRRAEPGSYRLW